MRNNATCTAVEQIQTKCQELPAKTCCCNCCSLSLVRLLKAADVCPPSRETEIIPSMYQVHSCDSSAQRQDPMTSAVCGTQEEEAKGMRLVPMQRAQAQCTPGLGRPASHWDRQAQELFQTVLDSPCGLQNSGTNVSAFGTNALYPRAAWQKFLLSRRSWESLEREDPPQMKHQALSAAQVSSMAHSSQSNGSSWQKLQQTWPLMGFYASHLFSLSGPSDGIWVAYQHF